MQLYVEIEKEIIMFKKLKDSSMGSSLLFLLLIFCLRFGTSWVTPIIGALLSDL